MTDGDDGGGVPERYGEGRIIGDRFTVTGGGGEAARIGVPGWGESRRRIANGRSGAVPKPRLSTAAMDVMSGIASPPGSVFG